MLGAIEKMIHKGLEEVQRIAFKVGGEAVRQAFGPVAGRELAKGNGEVMRVYNEVGRALKKM